MENKFVTLGCRLNTFESEVIKAELQKNNITGKIVVNTCAVTQKAEKDSLRQIKKLKKQFPGAEIIVTGCAVHTAIEQLNAMPEVAKIINNSKKLSVNAFIKQHDHLEALTTTQSPNKLKQSNTNTHNSKETTNTTFVDKQTSLQNNTTSNNKASIGAVFNNNGFGNNQQTGSVLNSASRATAYNIPLLSHFNNRTRGFVQIQQGCDHRCSFCIIHKTRGQSFSLEESAIIKQVNALVNNDYKEVTLTGVDISSWQRNISKSNKSKLGELCYHILKAVPELKRLRLSSLDPAVEDEALLELLQHEKRFMQHLHLSLQSMNNGVLNNMGRRHSKESAILWINKLKAANKNLLLGADIICGFPKESEPQFLDTFNTLKELNIPLLHVFPYSERSGTPAAKMEQLPPRVRKARALKLITLSNSLKKQFFNSKLGRIEEILVESNNIGHTKDYLEVKVVNKQVVKNSLIQTLITDSDNSSLIGEALNV